MSDSSLLSHNLFRSICGPTALKAAVMASTQWDAILHTPSAGPIREKDLKELWSNTLAQGAVYKRIDAEDPRRDTQNVIDYILARHATVTTQIQHELVDLNKRLAETEAAQKLRETSCLVGPQMQVLAQERKKEQLKELHVEAGFGGRVNGLSIFNSLPAIPWYVGLLFIVVSSLLSL